MGFDIFEMRDYVKKLYPYDGWKYKVNKMSDSQVIAIFNKSRSKPKKHKENFVLDKKMNIKEENKFKPIDGDQLKLIEFDT